MSYEGPGKQWRMVDVAPDRDRLLAFLDEVATIPAVAAAKERSFGLLGLRPGDRALDAGSGTGTDAVVMAQAVQPGGEVVGVDLSELAVATARERTAGRTGVRFQRADLATLPFPDGSFRAVRADRVLLHLPKPVDALHEMVRVTARGGRIVLCEGRVSGTELIPGRAPQHHEHGDLLPALPLMLEHFGVRDVVVEHREADVQLSDDALTVIGARGGPARLHLVLIAGTASGAGGVGA